MLITFWSPKGGSGTSVTAAACSVLLARSGGVRLADFGGDQPAILGLPQDPPIGITQFLFAGAGAPVERLVRNEIEAAPGLFLLPRGEGDLTEVDPESVVALAVGLRDSNIPVVADLGVPISLAHQALLEVSDLSILVTRACYIALRRATHLPCTRRADGVVFIDEIGRSLGEREVKSVLGVEVLATVMARASITKSVDAGLFGARLPLDLARPLGRMLDGFGLRGGGAQTDQERAA